MCSTLVSAPRKQCPTEFMLGFDEFSQADRRAGAAAEPVAKTAKPAEKEPEEEACACAAPSAAQKPAAELWTWTAATVGIAVLSCSAVIVALMAVTLSIVTESRDLAKLLVQAQLGVVAKRQDV